ncbi:peptidoglycan bridge formation glycyltransferase FemA/FemB family protein, partial [Bifidobacterium magnum]
QGFNGYVEELPGEFTLPVNSLRYGIQEFIHKLRK